jgi:cytochrome c556
MKKPLIIAASLISIALTASHAQAAEPLELQKIMRDLGRNMQTVTDGISREDWALVESSSHLIAEHPQPPLPEKMRILNFIGTNMSKFKGFDEQTHEAASEMAAAAQEENGHKVISTFQKIQSSCLGCHQSFRTGFVEHFYGKAVN